MDIFVSGYIYEKKDSFKRVSKLNVNFFLYFTCKGRYMYHSNFSYVRAYLSFFLCLFDKLNIAQSYLV